MMSPRNFSDTLGVIPDQPDLIVVPDNYHSDLLDAFLAKPSGLRVIVPDYVEVLPRVLRKGIWHIGESALANLVNPQPFE